MSLSHVDKVIIYDKVDGEESLGGDGKIYGLETVDGFMKCIFT